MIDYRGQEFYSSRNKCGVREYDRCKCGGKLVMRIGIEEPGIDFNMTKVFCENCHLETGLFLDPFDAMRDFKKVHGGK